MQIIPVCAVLLEHGLAEPELEVLSPTQDNYTALLFQPQGRIVVDNGVRHEDPQLADQQFGVFLEHAVATSSQLVVTPEYSMPWSTLERKLAAGSIPNLGSLWILGCESTALSDLHETRDRLADTANFIFEDVEIDPNKFLNPVAYVFHAKRESHDGSQLVVLVQFKTCPMGDQDHFEVNGMQRGSRMYRFGNGTTQLGLATLICSDAFAFTDAHAEQLYDRTLLIHIQLNPSPRQSQFRQYRSRFFQYGGGQTELICLNWAKDVTASANGSATNWRNISGSAWYLNLNTFDERDETLVKSHRRGLYYTWIEDLRSHALFFNYEPALYRLTASKVAHIGVRASLSRRRGPQLDETLVWDEAAENWIIEKSVDDGFSSIVSECGGAKADVQAVAATNPFVAERLLALCAGAIESIDWHILKKLDSCAIESSEIVRRITACQDEEASPFREDRLRKCMRLHNVLQSNLPSSIADLKDGFTFIWHPDFPHQNVVSSNGRRATLIYLGDTSQERAQNISKIAADHLGDSFSEPDDIIEGRQRLHVWYRDSSSGNDVPVAPHAYTAFDEARTDSPFDIARAG